MFKAFHTEGLDVKTGLDLTTMSKAFKLMPRNATLNMLNQLAFVHVENAVLLQRLEADEPMVPKELDVSKVFEKTRCVVLGVGDRAKVHRKNGEELHLVFTYTHEAIASKTPFPVPKKPWEAHPPESALYRVERWLAKGELGSSSMTICKHLFGKGPLTGEEFRHPLDPDDLRRCVLFVRAVPEAAERIKEMGVLSPEWAALSAHWEELTELLDAEMNAKGKSREHKCYDRMQALLNAASPRSGKPAP